jgi:phosphoribosylformylglycinamidine synthase PurS subunit
VSAATFRARVVVRLDANVNDPQGNAVLAGLHSLGHGEVSAVRIGKVIELGLVASDAEAARERVERMCRELLANPTIETFEIAIEEG